MTLEGSAATPARWLPRRKDHLVPDGPGEHHVWVHVVIQKQADGSQFGAQDAASDQVGLRDVRHVPHASTQTHMRGAQHSAIM